MSACTPEIVTPRTPIHPPVLWSDESAVVSGICFEAAFDAAGQIFIVRDSEEHIHFYDLADNSHLCRHLVKRLPFDFDGGRVLAGLWSKGVGCTAHHNLTGFERDDSAQKVVVQLQFITEGDCKYELIRPFWIGIPGVADYEIEFVVS
jgi:hypothetical protein